MNLSADLFSTGWHLAALALSLLIGWLTWRTAPWQRLKTGPQLNLLLGFAVGLTLIWSLKAGVKPGLTLHMMGAMAATLALGPQLAIVALGLALTGIALNGTFGWQAWPINFLLMVVVPVLIAYRIHRLVERWLPAHFFVFIFVAGFFGSALTVMLQGLVASAVLVAAGAYSADFLASDYLPYFLLLGFSEGWISGGVITLMVVYRPEWVAAFDDRRYLFRK
ncbi:hypothetical protein E6C76_04435 [Pseudothauera nasutitermitis]|uniref:Energy-coupling factor ABC transporter permease n=1 Tax=Pseudothauera nasutitermitis TaxID=2565930 RepID=A0A4S4B303_9RHOO|nr:energy-coupling factor ABC transporter permease [Pseudothauera nasutitermitis]THF66110.1 hypothetical protein E6C76_04435 [Pseudothauera nasutitermitis]